MSIFERLSKKYNTPYKVQKLIRTWKYNKSNTIYSAKTAYEKRSAHCLEAANFAAAVLEHVGYPPLVVSVESIDQLDHVLFVFQKNKLWGSVAISRDEGLFGRKAVFQNIRALVDSYAEPYVDKTGRIIGYALCDLDESNTNWRYSNRNLWKLEKYLVDLKHSKFKMSERRYQKASQVYQSTGHKKQSYWL
jgi:hypothetical protein